LVEDSLAARELEVQVTCVIYGSVVAPTPHSESRPRVERYGGVASAFREALLDGNNERKDHESQLDRSEIRVCPSVYPEDVRHWNFGTRQ
jgi:hypothetical protein